MPFRTTRKPHAKPKPYVRTPRKPVNKHVPKSSARPVDSSKHRDNLTLHDWLSVFAYMDKHPSMTQADVVDYFKNRVDGGALIFNQSTLSRKRKNQEQLEEQAKLNPSALSYKRPQIVTHPDVKCAVVLWVKHMEEKHETSMVPC